MQFTALRFSIVLKAIREWRADHIHETDDGAAQPVRAIGFQLREGSDSDTV